MAIKRVAIIFDNTARPETTGFYCRRALGQLVEVEHFLPNETNRIPRDFDLYLNVDDGLNYQLPEDLRPRAWWAIDTHVDFKRCLSKAQGADYVFAAQKNGAQQLHAAGIPAALWLPLACDPEIHGRREVAKTIDVAFVGNIVSGPRLDLLQLIQERFPNNWIGRCYFDEMAKVYSAARIVFNRSIADDVNMRVFEALASGSLLLTNEIANNGQDELFQDGVHLVTYGSGERLLEKLSLFLTREDERERIAAAGQGEVLRRHTYLHRMQTILNTVEAKRKTVSISSTSGTAQSTKNGAYFHFARPEVLALVPLTAKRVLDVGCSSGRLGESIRQRQTAEVVGLELNSSVAEQARTRLDAVLQTNIESTETQFPDGRFDCVICADILEHLYEPLNCLKKIRRWLTPNGRLVASIPNIRHHSVVTSLLEGNWEYQSAGLLDNDHVRFFTKNEIEKLCDRSGFMIEQLQFVPGAGYEEWKALGRPDEFSAGKLRLAGLPTGDAEQFHAYQYLLTAVPTPIQDFGCTSIVIVTFNQQAYTRQCLHSLREYTDEDVQIIVIDNGSSDGTVEFLKTVPDITVITNRENLGYPAAVNQGIQAARGRQILLLNNDVVLTTGWLLHLLKALYSEAEIGLVGPYTNCTAGPQRIDARYALRELDDFAWRHRKVHSGQRIEVDKLTGFCLLLKREVIDRIGSLDERFGLGVYDDIDYCHRAAAAGFSMVIAADVFVHHFGHRSFHGNGIDQDALAVRNAEIFREKWAVETSPRGAPVCIADQLAEFSVTTPSTEQITSGCPDGKLLSLVSKGVKTCLLVGRTASRLARSLRCSHPEARLLEILSDNETVRSAPWKLLSTYGQTEIARNFPDGQFDCIVCETLCEFREPLVLLRQLRDWLRPTGSLIVEFPNVRHHEVITALLRGSWSPQPPDFSDEAPLRFCTRQELEKLLERAGFSSVEIRPVAGPGSEAWIKNGRPGRVSLGSLSLTGLPPAEAEEFFTSRFQLRATPAPKVDRGLTSIIIVTHNQLSYTRQCIDSIKMRTDEPYELIFVDNGSTDGTPAYLNSCAADALICNPDNRGFPAAVNQGLQRARGQNILLLNNDCIVTTGWLRRLIDALHSQRNVGMVGPCSNNVSGPQQISVDYDRQEGIDQFAWFWGKVHSSERQETDRLVGFCLMFRRELLETIGILDERFGIGCFEDDDYCKRARAAGFRAIIARDAFVHHFGSRTFLGSGVDFAAVLRENKQKFDEKWKPRPTVSDGSGQNESVTPFRIGRSPHGGLRLEKKAPKLSACLIVRDNEDTIRPCIASIVPWVDELIVVDTGSKDRTPDIVREYGAQIFHFPWCDDFSAARNESIRHATGEWIFWMDSDDTISADCGRQLRDLAYSSHPPGILGYIMQVHCPGSAEEGVTVVDHLKLFPNRPDLRFEGRIHEQILPSVRRAGGDVRFTEIYVTHSGSVRTPEGHRRKL
ncbi:MAG: wbbL 5, partial [Planctomycetaceae bacterium]|nr:wbbL 5 [Planctomycetaceae bacterium]